ncbi:MAG: sigma-70 family RNA polymerase sigma factor [Proteobacteria bacterium]|nr:sigma-70 family RNA polymerase sigma factor [Pseudomonadota bacterium]
MKRLEQVLQRFDAVSDDEWRVCAKKCKDHINLRLGNKTAYGAHSEKNLEMSPFDFYFTGAVTKLMEGIWNWKFEQYSLLEQLIRLIDSMISEEVRKYKTPKAQAIKVFNVGDHDLFDHLQSDLDVEPSEEYEKEFTRQIEVVKQAIDGDEELLLFHLCVESQMKYPEIAKEMNIDIKRAYKLGEKLKDKARKFNSGNSANK